jgi:hypothetical protein
MRTRATSASIASSPSPVRHTALHPPVHCRRCE